MTALNDVAIKALLDDEDPSRRLIITPLLDRDEQIGPGSVDLRLGTEFLETPRKDNASVDPFARDSQSKLVVPETRTFVPLGDEFILHPGQFALGATLEFLVLPPNISGQVLSRSSWGRLGLLVATAVAVQPGFHGALTLELVNAGSVPIVLRPGLRVAQLQMWAADSDAQNPYGANGKYRAPLGPESNRLAWEEGERIRLTEITNRMHARQVAASNDSAVDPPEDSGVRHA